VPASSSAPPANYDTAMRVVAYMELLILVRVVLGAVTFQNSLLAPLIFAHFLRQRYFQSAFTRDAVADITKRVDALVRKPGNPPVLLMVWDKSQMLVQRWAGVALAPNPAPAAAAR
jgi:hypothetical protein